MAPASGVVTLGGRPVAGVQATFMAPTAARPAYGTTDAASSAAMTQASRNTVARGDLPARYADAARSGLTAEVTTTGPNEFVFALEP
jgi:hypothetical protein